MLLNRGSRGSGVPVVPKLNIGAASPRSPRRENGNGPQGFQGNLRTPRCGVLCRSSLVEWLLREREAGLNGIFRMFDMERTGYIHKKSVELITTQATERAAKSGMSVSNFECVAERINNPDVLSGSWSLNQNQRALNALESDRRDMVEQSDFVDFFKYKWHNG